VERLIWEHVIQHGRFDLDVETPLDLTQMAPRDTTVGRTPIRPNSRSIIRAGNEFIAPAFRPKTPVRSPGFGRIVFSISPNAQNRRFSALFLAANETGGVILSKEVPTPD
jgi:hypothetical protein